jgi:transcriptional regulator with XRE-family HTH domain
MPTYQDPSFYRRRVREALRKARESASLTQRDAAATLDWSMSKLVRIEAGSVGISTTDLKALLALYGVDDKGTVDQLINMARASKEQPWFSRYQGIVSDAFGQYLGYESSASVIRGFQPLTVPGLFQTDDYARAILEASRSSDIEERIELRMTRQELLDRDDLPAMFYVLDEAALHRLVGGPTVMRGQLRRLKELGSLANVSIRIVPFSAGAHSSMAGSFTILEFADWDEDVLYLETSRGSVTSREDQKAVAEHRESFELLSDKSLNEEESIVLIESLVNSLRNS